MPTILTYKDLDAWKRAMALVERIYRVTAVFPQSEMYGLTSQLRRASVSIPANIAEGERLGMSRRNLHHVRIALGSHGELETCVEIGWRLGFISVDDRTALVPDIAAVGQLLNGLRWRRAIPARRSGAGRPAGSRELWRP